jgi:hypothetical protein
MGWNSWNHYGCNVSDALIREQADAMVSSGLKAAGYQYVNVDDCWEGKRDANGNIQPNDKFPACCPSMLANTARFSNFTNPVQTETSAFNCNSLRRQPELAVSLSGSGTC